MIYCQELIVSDVERKGEGKFPSPIRSITQVFSKEGNLIAQNDPLGNFSIEDLFALSNSISKGQTVEEWLSVNFKLSF